MFTLKGKSLKSITLSPDRDLVTFTLLDGSVQVYRAIGECCSYTWIEHLEVPSDIEGAVVLDITENSMPCHLCSVFHGSGEHDKCVLNAMNPNADSTNDDGKYIKVYQTTIVTTRGRIDLEYRNSSNGYYGGWLEEVA